jgi:hypothetical protein
MRMLVLLACALSAGAAEPEALLLLAELRARHLPVAGLVIDPIYFTPEGSDLLTYTRCGDSALWTGHLLAAEAYRWSVTGNEDAKEGAKYALEAVRKLVDASSVNIPARCTFPANWDHAPQVAEQEKNNGVYEGNVDGEFYIWIGNPSRDQYLGLFFGLNAAWVHIHDTEIQEKAAGLVTRMLDRLIEKNWAIVLPSGRAVTNFSLRPDQQLALLKTGAKMNPAKYLAEYDRARRSGATGTYLPILYDVLDEDSSYFKFNLNHITFFLLLAGDTTDPSRGAYLRSFELLRRTTDDHGNAYFDLLDTGIRGRDNRRDDNIRRLLDEWLLRPRRDVLVDQRGKVRQCGSRACDPLPVPDRVTTDFLWQRSPFQLVGGGTGRIEGPGIDYILPYWMARYYSIVE